MANENVTRIEGSLLVGVASAMAGVIVTAGIALYIAGNLTVAGNITVTGQVNQSGSIVPLVGAVQFSEVNEYASGAIAITNPVDEALLCDSFVIDVTTAANPATLVDVYVGTGSVAQIQKDTTGSILLFNNLSLTTGTKTSSGSGLVHGDGSRKFFKLAPSSSTTGTKTINVVSQNQTGATVVGTYNVNCYRTQ